MLTELLANFRDVVRQKAMCMTPETCSCREKLADAEDAIKAHVAELSAERDIARGEVDKLNDIAVEQERQINHMKFEAITAQAKVAELEARLEAFDDAIPAPDRPSGTINVTLVRRIAELEARLAAELQREGGL